MNTDTRLELRQREIIEEFEMFSDWMEKYEHIIEIGKELDPISEEHKVEDHGMFTTTFTRESWGLGTVGLKMINLPPSGGEFIMVNASCPVDNSNSILRWSMRVSKDIEDELGMAIIDGIANGVLDDMPIWDHKSYVADPILCDGDGPINKFRKWVSQFYSEPLQN